MRRSLRQSLVGLLVAGLAGCTGSVGTTQSGSGGSGGSSGTASGGNSGSATGGSSGKSGGGTASGGKVGTGSGGSSSGGSGAGGDPGDISCVPGIPGTTQVARLTNAQYSNTINDLLGVTTLTTSGGMSPMDLLAPDSTGSLTDIAWNGYLVAAEKIAAEVMANATAKAKFISCDPTQGTCLADTVKAFGRKAFRRPLTDDEIKGFQVFKSLTPAGSAADVSEALLYAILASPSFIMRPELAQDKDSASGALKLTSFEVASRLSYLLWSSTPDDMLSAAADANQLQTKEQILAQAQRLLKSPRAGAAVTTFHRAYAGIENGSHWANNTTHDTTKYPTFNSSSYTDAMAELDSFFQDLVLNGGTFKDLFTSPNAFVTKDTAVLYGLKASDYSVTPKKVALDPAQRPGFLTRVAFLSTFAHSDTTSPILRGAFVTQRVLGIPIPPPDPKNTLMQPPAGNYTTYRQAIEALTSPAACTGCHTTMVNPPGFVLERYNAVGTWQDKDQLGGDINSTADVMFASNGSNTKTISKPADLMAEIAKSPTAQRTYVQSWVRYAAQRDPNSNDSCIVDQISGNLSGGTYPLANMMADYTQADSFRLRTLGN
jgi:Protein of unknown function (DUF1592)/Protein of unknown function (DUF1588)/Protein of unknown function (DUF1595)/Protein of unknown function (DUF1585)/Protein of unknown function (DUF1587)